MATKQQIRTVKAAHPSKIFSRKEVAKMFRARKEGRPYTVKIREDGKRVVILERKTRG